MRDLDKRALDQYLTRDQYDDVINDEMEYEEMAMKKGTTVKVYVASSWRNTMQRAIVHLLRAAGHEAYDFREPTEGNHGFSWHEIDPTIPRGPANLALPAAQIRDMLDHPAAVDGFALDMGALQWCDACVLVLPCGRSAHLEAGWAVGAGKLTVGLLCDGEPDLMWKMLDHLVVDPVEILDVLGCPTNEQ